MASGTTYIFEPISEGLERRWKVDRMILSRRTKYQFVQIAETAHGVALFCDGERQSSELSQKAYHEGQVVPALISMPCLPKSALVIGSSEGVASQVLKEAGIEKIVHVDLDEECLVACSQLLPYGYSVDEVERYKRGEGGVTLIFCDGDEFLDRCIQSNTRFDLIVMDVPDYSSKNAGLYSASFYRKVCEVLVQEGVFITQGGNPAIWRSSALKKVKAAMEQSFAKVTYFELREQDWVWLIGHKDKSVLSISEMVQRLKELTYIPEYVDALTIESAVIPPISIRKGF
ncbi:hypothetical protein LZ023_28280 [Pseudomonas silvicola]|nr:hypothetical protein LZ023_28280 [Pseudomonas silvicola]